MSKGDNGNIVEVEKYLNEHKKKDPSKYQKYVSKKKKNLLSIYRAMVKQVKKLPNRWKFKKVGFAYERFMSEEDKM